jgi:hypothetical protein
MKILTEKSELSIKQKEIEKWEEKIYDRKTDITDLKQQLNEIKNNQIRMNELRKKAREE